MLMSLKAWNLRRRHPDAQLRVRELALILSSIRSYPACRMLVFGLGHDTPLWISANEGGETVFLEDDPEWFERVTGEYPEVTAFAVDYPHDITRWRELLEQPDDRLEVGLPAEVPLGAWDVVLVDAPRGYEEVPEQKGRMSAIYMASRLVAPEGRVFVHDAERDVERAYADKYLRDENMLRQVWGRALLRMYKAPSGAD